MSTYPVLATHRLLPASALTRFVRRLRCFSSPVPWPLAVGLVLCLSPIQSFHSCVWLCLFPPECSLARAPAPSPLPPRGAARLRAQSCPAHAHCYAAFRSVRCQQLAALRLLSSPRQNASSPDRHRRSPLSQRAPPPACQPLAGQPSAEPILFGSGKNGKFLLGGTRLVSFFLPSCQIGGADCRTNSDTGAANRKRFVPDHTLF